MRRFPLASRAWPANLAVQAAACFVLALSCVTIFIAVAELTRVDGLAFVDQTSVNPFDKLMRMALLFCLTQLLVRPQAAAPPGRTDSP